VRKAGDGHCSALQIYEREGPQAMEQAWVCHEPWLRRQPASAAAASRAAERRRRSWPMNASLGC